MIDRPIMKTHVSCSKSELAQEDWWEDGMVLRSPGSGAGTAIQAALPNALILDMEQGENAMQV